MSKSRSRSKSWCLKVEVGVGVVSKSRSRSRNRSRKEQEKNLIALCQKIPCACSSMYGNLLFLIKATHHTVPVQNQNAVL